VAALSSTLSVLVLHLVSRRRTVDLVELNAQVDGFVAERHFQVVVTSGGSGGVTNVQGGLKGLLAGGACGGFGHWERRGEAED
jgi:hypothetical protein